MSPITHLFIGWTVASTAPALTQRERAWVTWASVVPDIDGLGIIADQLTRNSSHPLNWWGEYHHTLGHNLTCAILFSVLAAIFVKQKGLTALMVFVSFHLHLLGDLMGARGPDGDQWPIPYLLPFSKSPELTWSGQWALNAWPNILITAILIGLALVLAHRRGYSPVELFSKKADEAFVRVLRNRFPNCGSGVRS